MQRLWISSLTESAIREGLRRLRPAREYDDLANAALGRSRADWLVGMNLSRAYGLALDAPLSVGRVQTPTLAIVFARELTQLANTSDELHDRALKGQDMSHSGGTLPRVGYAVHAFRAPAPFRRNASSAGAAPPRVVGLQPKMPGNVQRPGRARPAATSTVGRGKAVVRQSAPASSHYVDEFLSLPAYELLP